MTQTIDRFSIRWWCDGNRNWTRNIEAKMSLAQTSNKQANQQKKSTWNFAHQFQNEWRTTQWKFMVLPLQINVYYLVFNAFKISTSLTLSLSVFDAYVCNWGSLLTGTCNEQTTISSWWWWIIRIKLLKIHLFTYRALLIQASLHAISTKFGNDC